MVSNADKAEKVNNPINSLTAAQAELIDGVYYTFEALTGHRLQGWGRENDGSIEITAEPLTGGEEVKCKTTELATVFNLEEKKAFVLQRLLEADTALSDALTFLR